MKRDGCVACVMAATLTAGVGHAQTGLPAPVAPPPGWVAPAGSSAVPAPAAAPAQSAAPAQPPPASLPATASPAPQPAVAYPPWPATPAYAVYPPYVIPVIPVQLDVTEPNVDVLVYLPDAKVDRDQPIARCSGACTVNLVPGRYRIRVTESAETVAGDRTLSLTQPSRLVMDPDTQTHRSTGLVLGITGPIMLVAGIVTVLSQAFQGEHKTNDVAVGFGVFSLLGGLVATPVGWVVFGTAYKPEYELQPLVPAGYGKVPWPAARRAAPGPGLQWRLSS